PRSSTHRTQIVPVPGDWRVRGARRRGCKGDYLRYRFGNRKALSDLIRRQITVVVVSLLIPRDDAYPGGGEGCGRTVDCADAAGERTERYRFTRETTHRSDCISRPADDRWIGTGWIGRRGGERDRLHVVNVEALLLLIGAQVVMVRSAC